jgi:hypothetical protein
MSPPLPGPFLLPLLGLTMLFAAIGPAIGGAVFIPLASLLEAPVAAGATMHLTWIATLMGHAPALIPAYLFGFGPATVAGLVFGLWDVWAASRAPRAIAAAVIGGALTYGQFLWLTHISAVLASSISVSLSEGAETGSTFSFPANLTQPCRRRLSPAAPRLEFRLRLGGEPVRAIDDPEPRETAQHE